MHEADSRADGSYTHAITKQTLKVQSSLVVCISSEVMSPRMSHYYLPPVNHHRGTKRVHRSSTRDSPAITEGSILRIPAAPAFCFSL